MVIKDNNIELKPATMDDRDMIYGWMAKSNITKYLFDDSDIPTWEEFIEDYQDFYFDDVAPEKGRGFLILYKGYPVGFMNYASFHMKKGKAELDIWLKSEENCEKGIGSQAIRILCKYLKEERGIDECIIIPSIKNKRAIRAYEKSGFIRINMNEKSSLLKGYLKKEFLEEEHVYSHIYDDNVNLLLIKKL